jgi:hypothetical protein
MLCHEFLICGKECCSFFGRILEISFLFADQMKFMLGLQLLQILGMLSDSNLREEDDTMGG